MKTHTILIADDYPENINIIVDALKDIEIPHKIIKAINGEILCTLAEKRLPDLIITDWEMPEMDGIEAIRHLKTLESTRDIPIIMCTGIMTTSENLKMALDSGAIDFIRKPIDKIELLARVFSMLKLGESYRTIKEQNIILEQQKNEIQSKRDKLEIANATKDKFFSIIAHDLRNPFSTLIGFSNLLIKQINNHDFDKSYKFAQIIHESSSVAFELLENLLNWSRSQMEKIAFNPENLNLKPIIDSIILLLNNPAISKGIQISSSLNRDIFTFADKNMLLTILRNLITNAIKFSRKNDKIIVEVEESEDRIIVHISDTGVGIDEERLTKLFKVGNHIKTMGTAHEPGTGLGLILCKEFIDYHNGKIWVESKIGLGSKFSFSLAKANN